jgi:hypothetical protein
MNNEARLWDKQPERPAPTDKGRFVLRKLKKIN